MNSLWLTKWKKVLNNNMAGRSNISRVMTEGIETQTTLIKARSYGTLSIIQRTQLMDKETS